MRVVLRHALALGVNEAESHFGVSIAVNCQWLQQTQCPGIFAVTISGRAILQRIGCGGQCTQKIKGRKTELELRGHAKDRLGSRSDHFEPHALISLCHRAGR